MLLRGHDTRDMESRQLLAELTNNVYTRDDAAPTFNDLVTMASKYQQDYPIPAPLQWKKDVDLLAIFQKPAKAYLVNRRLKMSSLLKFSQRARDLASKLVNLDYQLAVNILLWAELLSEDETRSFFSLKIFASREQFLEVAELLSATVKPYGQETRSKRIFGELHTLAGYKHEDASWDTDKEMEKLASSKPQRIDGWDALWNDSLEHTIVRPPQMPKYRDFEEYTKSFDWATSGSSSVGRVYYVDSTGKDRHFKPRKNMVTALFTPDEVWDIVSKWDGRIRNTPVIKNELGKIRLAIASNFESYIYEAYCMEIFGHGFKNWGGITLDEKVSEEVHRTTEDMDWLRANKYALPWDFAQFDHQVRTVEIQSILTKMKGFTDPRSWDKWDRVIASYDNATLGDKMTGKVYTITNGLQSGQRVTSLIGNVWNAIVTRIAIGKASAMIGYDIRARIGIRGDDTYILAAKVQELYMIRLVYASLQIIGHDKKFSIRPWSFEFLRNTTTTTSVIGWPARAIPAITERKPWSDDLLQPHLEVVTIADNIRNVERRIGTELKAVHLANRFQWTKFTRQSHLWLELPRRLGGLGIYPFRDFIPDGKLSLTPDVSQPAGDKFSGYSPAYLGLNAEQSVKYNKSRLLGMMRPSDTREGLSMIIDRFNEKVRILSKFNIKWKKTKIPLPEIATNKEPMLEEAGNLLPRANLSAATAGWPSFSKLLGDYPHYRYAMGSKAQSLKQLAKQHYPSVHNWLKYYERWGWHRADAIDIILGNLPIELPWPLNPKTKDLCLTQAQGIIYKPPRGYCTRNRIGYYVYALTRSVVTAFRQTNTQNMFLY
ncbi:MAG: hypothetical protein 2 [Zeugodacus tau toti-like virus 2]|nr:MAG: hypothetical protein 2 [Zeugodacus tau toti-like virus 2]